MPGGIIGAEKRPSAPVVSVQVAPVASLRTVTVAPGAGACCASVTRPPSVAVGPWASAGRVNVSKVAAHATAIRSRIECFCALTV